MADSKRQSIAGKVAIPRTGASSPAQVQSPSSDSLDSLTKAVGSRVKLTTQAPQSQSYEGDLYSVCSITRLVAISSRSTSLPTAQDYHIIPVSRVQSFDVLGHGSVPTHSTIVHVDQPRSAQKLADRVRKLKEEEQNRGKGVTAEGQAIFDSFKRINTPIRWHNQEMIVYDAVIISPPYTVEDCRGAKDKQEVLNRVKKVLEGERRKLKEKHEREKKPATPINNTSTSRKGG